LVPEAPASVSAALLVMVRLPTVTVLEYQVVSLVMMTSLPSTTRLVRRSAAS
jgi:hypothetical protein